MPGIKSFIKPLVPQALLSAWAYRRRSAAFDERFKGLPRAEFLSFQCNICGHDTSYPRHAMSREEWSCMFCGSNVRWRSVIHALSMELFGKSFALPDFPVRKEIQGVGLSDWEGYAKPLSRKLGYVNTFYHKPPLLDVTSLAAGQQDGIYDFIISSDVFEHIPQPISRAFNNARRLLKPGGVMIFTVPYVSGVTQEHFPLMTKFSIEKRGQRWVLENQKADGSAELFDDLVFHGGPGTTVEFRLFGKDSLARDVASFSEVRIHDETVQEFGICWNPYDPEHAPYRPLIHGLDTPPWALVKDSAEVSQ